MKIAILSFYSGLNERGVERWVLELATKLSKCNQVKVFQNNKNQKSNKYNIESAGVDFDPEIKERKLDITRRAFLHYQGRKIAQFTIKIFPKLWIQNYDLIISTDGGWESAFVRILTWLKGKKMVIVGHSGIGWDDLNNLYCFPDVFVALSSKALRWAKKINTFVKSVYIPDGVDLNMFNKTGEKVEIGLPKPIILMVGAPEKGKRMELAINAVAKLKDPSLLILGGGYNEKNIRMVGKTKLGKRFLMKKVEFNEIPKYYRSCSLFTLPSWENEAFGMVYIEAMASGLPVVATDDELRREIIGEAGILVNPTDLDAYSTALQKALETAWHDKPVIQAKKFSWDFVVGEYEKLFKELVS
ncbi:hypothetical protein A2685_02010 [Candidatus Woesebacteria bacterium RIFCSPHIGHO2_01_FULL_37_10]|uniref:Glycosyl transferase family 1 domain-containing protein n=1 Tax=Candidatus Woesebacteria bacterium RIFCSPHIGHO2_01_FULL_37_10 TaxID=1802489 RepID=A0A1F7XWH0_9BACT|nr:MAG: hypothetical protein A2685_02010 [Candidatus Woesebacteria bacterium RIFCSPHIGHO2_01_FULL_37_10]